MSSEMGIFKSITNRPFRDSYAKLPKTSFIHKMSKNNAHTGNEHLVNTRNENLRVKSTIL